MNIENCSWYADYYRTTDDKTFVVKHFIKDFLFQHRLRYMVFFRTAQKTKSKLIKFVCEVSLFRLCRKYGLEIKTPTKIGRGFCLLHPYNITVSPGAIIGRNVTMMKGATVGLGKSINGRAAPIIGDRVYIGLNSTILGGVTIGDDVVIAPNTLVTSNVPSHSVVVGNPCEIHHKDYATEKLIWKRFCEDNCDE